MKIFNQKRLNVLIVLHAITLILWLLAKPNMLFLKNTPFLALAQIAGLWAATIVSLNFVLAARLKTISQFLGGLDKAYLFHTQTGKIAFFYMLIHPTLILVDALPNTSLLSLYIKPFVDISYDMGKISLFLFTTLLILTLIIKLPYHIWRRTHQLMVIPMLFLLFHIFLIVSDVSAYMPLRIWMIGMVSVGIILYVYKMFIYPFYGPKHMYIVKKITDLGIANEIILKPISNKINFEPGQFVFVQFISKKVNQEEHPFSVSSSPHENYIRLTIKKSGDFTNKLGLLKVGEKAKIYGPYGLFGQKVFTSKKPLVFIAGGIGITPFLSILSYLSQNKINKKVRLFYTYSGKSQAIYKKELNALKNNQITIITHNSRIKGRITAKKILKATSDKNALIFLCGPIGMMKSLSHQFKNLGINEKNILFEDFNLKKQ